MTDSCEAKMGDGGAACLWDAVSSGCQQWCRDNSRVWIPKLFEALDKMGTAAPLLLSLDRMTFFGKSGAFLRGDPEVDLSRFMEADEVSGMRQLLSPCVFRCSDVTIYLSTTDGGPGVDCMDRFEYAPYGHYYKYLCGVSKAGDNQYSLQKPESGAQTLNREACTEELNRMLAGQEGVRLWFKFNFLLTDVPPSVTADLRAAHEENRPDGQPLFKAVSGGMGRTYLYELGSASCASGGTHVLLDCGTFVADWHTLLHMLLTVDAARGMVEAEMMMSW